MLDYKQVIIYNKNSQLSFNQCLKYIVLGSINSVDKSFKNNKEKVQNWLKFGQKKVTLHVPHESDLLQIQSICENKKINCLMINNENDIPCILVLGPDLEKIIDPITGNLKLF